MFQFNFSKALKAVLLSSYLITSAFSSSAQAKLTEFTNNGASLVYSSISDATWPKDANLLATMMATDSSLVSKIVAASTGKTYGTTSHAVSASDFKNSSGDVTWWGAMAFVTYLNKIGYGGYSDWMIPQTILDSYVQAVNANFSNDSVLGYEFSELFYKELNGIRFEWPVTNTFINQKSHYWCTEEHKSNRELAWMFRYSGGDIKYLAKDTFAKVWPISRRFLKDDVILVGAFYGKEGQPTWEIKGNKIVDIVRASQQSTKQLYIPANMNQYFGGDPLPNQPKIVAVQIQFGNQNINLRQIEGKALQFPGVEGTDYWIVK